ncbi:MAG: universal stress protein [Candidatus Moranbacteria bacterium]|nr:universal stress protein [Candidatus Moranbacteria bacterium]MBP6033941.1 universal stress protein [Candidatus Moranbacteria bacterium]MBP7695600.1 universal stress protein [Candidatus Moranbacteria bacterium]
MEMGVVGKKVKPVISESALRQLYEALERAGFTQAEIQLLTVTPLLLMQIKQVLQGRIPEIRSVPIAKECLEPYVPDVFCSIWKSRDPVATLVERVRHRGIDILVQDTDVFDKPNESLSDDEDVYFIRLAVNDFHLPSRRTYAPQILNPGMLQEWSRQSLSPGWEVSFCRPDDVLYIALLDDIEILIRKPIRIAMSPVVIDARREIFQLQYIGKRLTIVPIPAGQTAVFPRHFPMLFRLSKIESA